MEITETGQSHLIVVQETINLELGWEIGIFDSQAIINDGNCETEYGELLVAAGIWEGNQLNITAIGSIDFCDVGGQQRSGYIEDNEIKIRLYDPEEMTEYTTSYITFDGIEPSFISGFVTAVSEIIVDGIFSYNSIDSQNSVKDFNIYKIYPNPANPFINLDFELNMNNNKIDISVFSINGDLVQSIINSSFQIGMNSIQIELSNYPSGNYFFQLKSEGESQIKKFIVLK
tara:strand:+ start:760 stop:1449 length:690 start_codon:yes stop_codon:yes gene_type:complete